MYELDWKVEWEPHQNMLFNADEPPKLELSELENDLLQWIKHFKVVGNTSVKWWGSVSNAQKAAERLFDKGLVRRGYLRLNNKMKIYAANGGSEYPIEEIVRRHMFEELLNAWLDLSPQLEVREENGIFEVKTMEGIVWKVGILYGKGPFYIQPSDQYKVLWYADEQKQLTEEIVLPGQHGTCPSLFTTTEKFRITNEKGSPELRPF